MAVHNEIAPGYLAGTAIVDYHHPEVRQQATRLAAGRISTLDVARRCYEFVRDEIAHSFDIGGEAVSCSASEVLQLGHGICYAQSHLLAALLRSNGIPSGFGYQRLKDDEGGFCLHGYNSVFLPEFGWYRIDARGNTGIIDAQFAPPQVRLAFATDELGEIDYNVNLAAPLTGVVTALQSSVTVDELRRNLPSNIPMG